MFAISVVKHLLKKFTYKFIGESTPEIIDFPVTNVIKHLCKRATCKGMREYTPEKSLLFAAGVTKHFLMQVN